MTPVKKAEELLMLFMKIKNTNNMGWAGMDKLMAKQCALIAVDEISEHCYQVMKPFWIEVKLKIEKL